MILRHSLFKGSWLLVKVPVAKSSSILLTALLLSTVCLMLAVSYHARRAHQHGCGGVREKTVVGRLLAGTNNCTCSRTETVERCIQSNFTLLFSGPVYLFPADSFAPDSLLQGALARGTEKPPGKNADLRQMTGSGASRI